MSDPLFGADKTRLLSRDSVRLFLLSHKRPLSVLLLSLFVLSFFVYGTYMRAPVPFPEGVRIPVPEGSSLSAISTLFFEAGVVRSPRLLSLLVRLEGGEKNISSGEYFFPRAENVFVIAKRLAESNSGLTLHKVTIREGLSVREIADLLGEELPLFDRTSFLALASSKEGRLFPDTYFFLPNESASSTISRMESNFNAQIAPLEKDIHAFGKPLPDILIVASLVEKEAASSNDRRLVAGILWKRLAIGMPLQVDAAFTYVNGGRAPSAGDIKIDTPYNTYLHRGLPPTPIGNPSLDAIRATVTPLRTDYLYYISDDAGVLHYAKTFEEHQANQKKYFR